MIERQRQIVIGLRASRGLRESLTIVISGALIVTLLEIFICFVHFRPGDVLFHAFLLFLLKLFQFLASAIFLAQSSQHSSQLETRFARCGIQLQRFFKL